MLTIAASRHYLIALVSQSSEPDGVTGDWTAFVLIGDWS